MKRSSFIAMVLGTVSGVLFALGMCMALIPEWNALGPGIVFGGLGLILGLATLLIWRRMERKAPIRFTGKALGTAALGIAGALALGVGMCFCMVWDKMVLGIGIGLVGMILLLCLIPITKGVHS